MAAGETLNRIERRKVEFRDRITRAALKLFEQQGVAETSIASIIVEADIAHKTFFNHFPTKDHLLLHVANTFSGNAYALFEAGLEKQLDPRKRLEFCLMSIASALEDVHPHYKELMNIYLISGSGPGRLQQLQKQQFTALVEKILQQAKKEGSLRNGFTVDTLTDMVVGISVSTLLNWSLEDDYPITPKMKKAVKFLDASIFREPG